MANRGKSESIKLSKKTTFRVNDVERRLIEDAAQQNDMTLSEYLRAVLAPYLPPQC
jgi:uncharacterized protein (DUF1778 family)